MVNEVQIRQLSDVIALLDDVLADEQKRYFIVIDRLDEDWIEEQLRMRLIRALIETVKDFTRVKHAKIVVAIRLDLLERVFRLTRDAGFQEEKYESLFLPLDWTRVHLTEILETRINCLIQSRYTQARVKYNDILPRHIDDQPALEYKLTKTMMRPRDLIQFFNFCIAKAVDRPTLTAQIIREAEGEYSRHRLRSLADEWFADYPNLIEFTNLLQARPQRFSLRQVSDEECADFALGVLTRSDLPKDELQRGADQLVNMEIDGDEFRRIVFYSFYRLGVVGLRAEHSESPAWAISGRRSLSRSEIPPDCEVHVHPMFWRVLHCR